MVPYFRYVYKLYLPLLILVYVLIQSAEGQIQGKINTEELQTISSLSELFNENIVVQEKRPEWENKLNPVLRSMIRQSDHLQKRSITEWTHSSSLPLSLSINDAGERSISVFIRTDGISTPSVPGLEVLTQIEDIVVARIPVNSLEYLARDPGVIHIDASMKRNRLNNEGRKDVGADKVHQGIDLPSQYRGEGVLVGVIDSGIDFTHPDFSNEQGSRIQYLIEYTPNGFVEWSKSQIDANPGSVTQRDLDETFGHGTHVTGSAAGGGKVNPDMMGVAPESDIIFVKGLENGGFPDEAVVLGTQYIFNKAAELGKSAVVNLSLGSNFGPLDGSSEYEEALSNLTGPGRIIVAAAGNEGFELIHAGGNLPASTRNATILLPNNYQEMAANMWYKPGVVSHVAIGAIYFEDGEFFYLGNTDFVPVGSLMDYTPFVYDEILLGYVGIDARTTNDPRNGDGNIFIEILGDPENEVYLSNIIWVVIYDSNVSGQFNMWSFGGEFYNSVFGFQGVNEVLGSTTSTIGSPATAKKIIAVGSHVTKSNWVDIDGMQRQWSNPHPSRDPNQSVVAQLGQRSYFSSQGPTRDGRIAPDITAPGELIFSSLSSHLTEDQGYERPLVLQGGQYVGMQGTSMASPHVAGIVALMLQRNPTLTYEEVLQILQQTARSDSHTGSLPNNLFGAGKVDAHAAVQNVQGGGSVGPGEPTVLRYFDPQTNQNVVVLDTVFPIDSGFVYGTNRYLDRAKATAFTLPDGQPGGEISEVKIWFAYKRDGLTNETYHIHVYGGAAQDGPSGTPIASHEYQLRDINADATIGTQNQPTVHTFSQPITVGSNFFVAVDFGAYDQTGAGNAAIATTDFLGQRVSEEWEQWNDGAWHNISDAWTGQQEAAGTGTNGAHMWIEVNLGTAVSVPDDGKSLPTTLALEQNYPNPFNPVTVIQYSVPEAAHVSLIVYDVLGREVQTLVDSEMEVGTYKVNFEANNLSSGLYFYRLSTGYQSIVRKMMLLR